MGRLNYNEITDDGNFSKSDVGLIVKAVNDNDDANLGANIRRFIKKARDYKAGRYLSKPPKVVVLGDSITTGVWMDEFKQFLIDTYGIESDNVIVYAYGGYSIDRFMPNIDAMLLQENPDLVFFNENEWEGEISRLPDNYIHLIEQIIKRVRANTVADIIIGTWSMGGEIALDYYNGVNIYEDRDYQFFNWYRDIACVYNCELIDFNQAILNYIDLGNDPTGHYDGVHWDSEWYSAIWTPECIKHFRDFQWQQNLNEPYPTKGNEQFIWFQESDIWNAYKTPLITKTGTWDSISGIYRGQTSATITIKCENIIGFQIKTDDNTASKSYSIEIDGGAGFVSPSAMRPFGKLMEYATVIQSSTYSITDQWRSKRLKMMAEVTNSFGDNNQTPLRYTILVTNVAGTPNGVQTITYDIKDEVGTVLWSGTDYDTDIVLANITLPTQYNGFNNYTVSNADATFPAFSPFNFVVGDEYEFYIKSNWVDTVDANAYDSSEVFGLEPGDYDVKITVNQGDLKFVGINLLKSSL